MLFFRYSVIFSVNGENQLAVTQKHSEVQKPVVLGFRNGGFIIIPYTFYRRFDFFSAASIEPPTETEPKSAAESFLLISVPYVNA